MQSMSTSGTRTVLDDAARTSLETVSASSSLPTVSVASAHIALSGCDAGADNATLSRPVLGCGTGVAQMDSEKKPREFRLGMSQSANGRSESKTTNSGEASASQTGRKGLALSTLHQEPNDAQAETIGTPPPLRALLEGIRGHPSTTLRGHDEVIPSKQSANLSFPSESSERRTPGATLGLARATAASSSSSLSLSQPKDHRASLGALKLSSLPAPLPIGSPENIRSLIAAKERELHDINDYRLRTLEQALSEKDRLLSESRAKFSKLKEDFQYNLKLIEDRDAELDRYDASFAANKNLLREKDREIAAARVQVQDLESKVKAEINRTSSQESYWQDKVKEIQEQLEKTRWERDDELRRQREEFDSVRRDLQRQIREKEEDHELQRREMSAGFDEVMRQREQETKEREERQEQASRDASARAQKAAREAEIAVAEKERASEQLVAAEEATQDALQRLKSAEWQLEDLRKLKDAKIAEVEAQRESAETLKKQLLDEYEGKMSELLQSLHAVERAFVQQREQFQEELEKQARQKDTKAAEIAKKLEERVRDLQLKVKRSEEETEGMRTQFKQAQWEYEEQLELRQKEVDRITDDMKTSLSQRDALNSDLKSQLGERETELKRVLSTQSHSAGECRAAQDQASRYKAELAAAVTREEALKRELRQSNARWERRWQEREATEKTSHDELVRTLQQQRDHLGNEKREALGRITALEEDLSRTRAQLHAVNARLRLSGETPRQIPPPLQDHGLVSSGADGHAPLSPAFSEDMGAASPLKPLGVSFATSAPADVRLLPLAAGENLHRESIHPSEGRWGRQLTSQHHGTSGAAPPEMSASTASHRTKVVTESDLVLQQKQENERLRLALSQMREEMTRAAGQRGGSETLALGGTHGAVQSLHIARSGSVDISVDGTVGEAAQASRANDSLRSAPVYAPRGRPGMTLVRNSQVLRNREENDALKVKLDEAGSDLRRLMSEREKLIEISNQLKHDLSKVMAGGGAPGAAGVGSGGGSEPRSAAARRALRASATVSSSVDLVDTNAEMGSLEELAHRNSKMKAEVERLQRGDQAVGHTASPVAPSGLNTSRVQGADDECIATVAVNDGDRAVTALSRESGRDRLAKVHESLELSGSSATMHTAPGGGVSGSYMQRIEAP